MAPERWDYNAVPGSFPASDWELLLKAAVFSTRRLFPEADALLRRSFRLARAPERAEGILVQLTDLVDARFLDRSSRLRVVSQCAAGVDNIDLEAAALRGTTVMNTPGVLTDATADLTWGLILAVARRIPEADRLCRSGRFSGWDPEMMLGRELAGRTLGIIGTGRIGTAVARRGLAFGMRVICHRRSRRPLPLSRLERVGFKQLMKRADVVSLHVPADTSTFHMIGKEALALMKPTAILVNTSRGALVDEKALIEALQRGSPWGAGLDVFEDEPRIPPALRRMNRVALTPHIGSATRETRGPMALTAVRNPVDFFRGKPHPDRVVTLSR